MSASWGFDGAIHNSGNDFNGAVSVTKGNNVTLRDTNELKLGASTVSGTLSITAARTVSQADTGKIKAHTLDVKTLADAGSAPITLFNANEVEEVKLRTLNSADNTIVYTTISYKDADGFKILGINNGTPGGTGGTVTLEAGGTVNQTGVVKGAELSATLSGTSMFETADKI